MALRTKKLERRRRGVTRLHLERKRQLWVIGVSIIGFYYVVRNIQSTNTTYSSILDLDSIADMIGGNPPPALTAISSSTTASKSSRTAEREEEDVQEQIIANLTERPATIYYCDNRERNEVGPMLDTLSSVLPEYVEQNLQYIKSQKDELTNYLQNLHKPGAPPSIYDGGNPYDIYLTRIGQSCTENIVNLWLQHHFPGKIVLWTPESVSGPTKFHDNTYELGPVPPEVDHSSHAMQLTHLQIIFWSRFHRGDIPDNRFRTFYNNGHHQRNDTFLFQHSSKPRNTGKHFLIYAHSNCVPKRDEAFNEFSKIGIVHAGGSCPFGRNQIINSPNKTRIDSKISIHNWADNALFFKDYRFCLVMEHGLQEGYITEKILLAFYSGCVPIYYGPQSIFDMFNKKSFVFYDPNNPKEALNQVLYLETNATAYESVMREPILHNGQTTIEKFFSLSDNVGGGKLKQQIRTFLGLNRYKFIAATEQQHPPQPQPQKQQQQPEEQQQQPQQQQYASSMPQQQSQQPPPPLPPTTTTTTTNNNNNASIFCESCLFSPSEMAGITCEERASYLEARYGHSKEVAQAAVLEAQPTNCRVTKKLGPCRIALENKADYHYEIIESTALRYPLPWDQLGCDTTQPIIFDVALSQIHSEHNDEKQGWIEYFESRLQGQQRRRIDGTVAKFGDLVDYRTYENHSPDAIIGISCDSNGFRRFVRASRTNFCVLHGICQPKCSPEVAKRSCWLTPMQGEGNCYFVPSDFPKFPTIPSSMSAVTNVCVSGHRLDANFEPLATAIAGLPPDKKNKIRLMLFQRKNEGVPLPFRRLQVEEWVTIVQESKYLDFQREISRCHLFLPLIDPIINHSYFPQSYRKLSGSIAQLIGNRIPSLVHQDVYEIWKDHFTAPSWSYNTNVTDSFVAQFEIALTAIQHVQGHRPQ